MCCSNKTRGRNAGQRWVRKAQTASVHPTSEAGADGGGIPSCPVGQYGSAPAEDRPREVSRCSNQLGSVDKVQAEPLRELPAWLACKENHT